MSIERRTSNIEHRTQSPPRAHLLRLRRSMFDVRCSMFSLLLLACSPAPAQEDAELPPPPKRPGVQITFIPPPLTGTLSLGIYHKEGKLVRTLHREAKTKEFVVGLNGLITWWDGKTDAGAVAPVGNYSARGYAVGAVEFAGEAFHFNDWIDDEKAPRLRRVTDLRADGGGLRLIATLRDGRGMTFTTDSGGKVSEMQPFGNGEHFVHGMNTPLEKMAPDSKWKPIREAAEEIAGQSVAALDGDKTILAQVDEHLLLRENGEWRWLDLETMKKPVHACLGSEGTLWVIDQEDTGVEVRQYSFAGVFMRRLALVVEDPQPVRIAATVADDSITLIEEAVGVQRVRTLKLAGPKSKTPEGAELSFWLVTFSKSIRASDDLAAVQADLKTEAGTPFTAVEKINVRLLPNQLVKNAITSVDVGVAVDARGSFLRTADGLPLKRITETPGLKWVAMVREPDGGKAVTIFQSDGAVVEEFKAKKLANMMAFDAGDYEWPGK